MQTQQSAPLVEELLQALGDKVGNDVTVEALTEEVQRFLDYGVPPEQAKNAILRHHGVAAGPPPGPSARRTLSDLGPSESFVNLLVRVVTVNEKDITVRGEPRRIQYGILGDESMTRPFTAWKTLPLEAGQVVRIIGAYTRAFQGNPEVQLGDRAQVEPAAPDAVPETPERRVIKVGDLAAGMGNVDVTARILDVGARTVNVQGTEKTVWSGTLGDATGKVRFSSWFDFALKPGQAVRVQGGYVRSFRSTPEFSFDEKATVEVLPDDAAPTADEIRHAGPVALADLYAGGGALDVTVEATLVEVRPGSGIVHRCTECKRVVTAGACRLHGKVDAVPDLRIKAVLDDGTGAINAVLGREVTEALWGKTFADAERIAKDAGDAAVIEAELKARLVARPMRARGNVVVDDFGPTLLVQEATLVQRDLTAAAEALLAELEGAA